MLVTVTTTEDTRFSKLLDELAAGGFPVKAMPLLARAIDRVGQEVTGNARRGRFHGKGPYPVAQNKLGQVSGRLGKSLRSTAPQVNLRLGQISISFGSNMVYFAVHEFGFDGQVGVKQHTRRLLGKQKFIRGKLTKNYQQRLKKKLARRHFEGTGSGAGTTVRAHRRRMKVPARRPFGTELESPVTSAAFLKAMAAALTAALKLR